MGPRGLLVWYFPSESRPSLLAEGVGVARFGIVIGADHPTGSYRVFGVFSKEPLTRDYLRGVLEAHVTSAPAQVTILETKMEVVAP